MSKGGERNAKMNGEGGSAMERDYLVVYTRGPRRSVDGSVVELKTGIRDQMEVACPRCVDHQTSELDMR